MPGGVAEHTHACDAGNAEACDDAGTDWRLGRAKPQSDVRAVALYRRACDSGSDAGCSNLALAYRSGAGVDVDYELSKRLYSQACEHGFAQACAGMGDMYEHQIPEARDPVQAAKFYERACTLGDAIGCAALGEMYQLGHGVPRTPRKSLELYLLACRCRNAYGCAHGADLAAGLGKNEIADALYRGAAALNQAGCDDGDPYDCSLLGDQYRDGKGVPRDRDRALRLYTFGCQRHMTAGCDGLRSLLELQTDAPSPRD